MDSPLDSSTPPWERRTMTRSNPQTSKNLRSRGLRMSTAASRASRPRTAISSITGIEAQNVICAISESRGISPTVGLAFVNLDTSEAVLCQICDSQTFARTIHQLYVYLPSEILMVSTGDKAQSKLFAVVEESMDDLGAPITLLDRRYYSENKGQEYIQQLAFPDDVEAIKFAIAGNYFAICCFAAALKYIEHNFSKTFSFHSLRIRYEPSDGSMMIDLGTVYALELIQNSREPRSKECLFGLLNETQSSMGSRLLRSNILQPITNSQTLNHRYNALEELTTNGEVFSGVREALKGFVDADKLLTSLITIPTDPSLASTEQSLNQVIMLKQYVSSIRPVYDALDGVTSGLLEDIRKFCAPVHILPVEQLISTAINDDVRYSKLACDIRNQRTFAVRAGVHNLLDVSRTTYKENSDDVLSYISKLGEEKQLKLDLKYDNVRQYYIRFAQSELDDRAMPEEFINIIRKKDKIECSTLHLVKANQKIADSHNECLLMSNETIEELIAQIRPHIPALFKVCESIAMLDMLSGFAQIAITQDYVRPTIGTTFAIEAARHPIKEKIQRTKFVPNDIFATPQRRLHIITGCNMSGKSTYLRTVALLSIMAQTGSFVPATYAMLPLHTQLFARVAVDADIREPNMSTFAAEMQETAFILRNMDSRSLAIVDELGRGTASRDGLAIALAVAEALLASRALVWFATHFADVAKVLATRPGVVALHLAVEAPDANTLVMLYKLAVGEVKMERYGLALAKLVPLPREVLEVAEHVSCVLVKDGEKRKNGGRGLLMRKKRRLLLELKELLSQAREGTMQGEELRTWMKGLQRDFVRSMTALEHDIEVEVGHEDDDVMNSEDGEVIDDTMSWSQNVESIGGTSDGMLQTPM